MKLLIIGLFLLNTLVGGNGEDTARAQAGRTYKRGESVQLTEKIKMKVEMGKDSAIGDVNVEVKGQKLVLTLALDGGESNPVLSLASDPDPQKSEIALLVGDVRLSPKAIRVEIPDYPQNRGPVALGSRYQSVMMFYDKAFVYLLFDIPTEQAGKGKKLSLNIGNTPMVVAID
jgi:hypothetical protein